MKFIVTHTLTFEVDAENEDDAEAILGPLDTLACSSWDIQVEPAAEEPLTAGQRRCAIVHD